MTPPALLPVLAAFALLGLAAAATMLVAARHPPALAAHVAFALGILPLILSAMAYFVPVLSRTERARLAGRLPPLLALVAGAIAVAAFATDYSRLTLALSASLALAAATGLGTWTLGRAWRMVGARHRGLDWYLAALGFLVLALLAVVLMPFLPAWQGALRLFHLHANLLGFVGLAALGTLHVLLPTCLGQADPGVGARLARGLRLAGPGALMISLGAAVSAAAPDALAGRTASVVGAICYGAAVVQLLLGWRRFGARLIDPHGAAGSLVVAAAGLAVLLGHGVIHALGDMPARPAVAGFVVAFLFPLVSGAAAQLLPVWLRPGVQGEWHYRLRGRLCRWAGLRGLGFLAIGVAFIVAA